MSPTEGAPFVAAVLCGGASQRMGTDKARLVLDGQAMAVRVAAAARSAGAARVSAIGGDAVALRALGLDVVPDLEPGGGPLVATLSALEAMGEPIVLVLACDLVSPDPAAMAATVAALRSAPDADVAVPVDRSGRPQWVHTAWRSRAIPGLARARAEGVRSLHGAVDRLTVLDVEGLADAALLDADRPEDLPGGG